MTAEEKRIDIELDAERYRVLRDLLESSVGSGVTINDEALFYEDPDPEGIVRLYWYPRTPVGFNEVKGDTLDDVIDEIIRAKGGV